MIRKNVGVTDEAEADGNTAEVGAGEEAGSTEAATDGEASGSVGIRPDVAMPIM